MRRGGDFWTLTLLAAGREWRERVGARSYRISTVILVVAIVLAIVIPSLASGASHPARVGVVGGAPAATAVVQQAGRVLDTKVRPVGFTQAAAARAALRHDTLKVVYIPGSRVLIRRPAAGGGDSTAKLAGAIAQLAGAGSARAQVRALPVSALEGKPIPLSTRLTGLAAAILIYLLVFIYGQRITSGVVEEKSTRVAEVLLSSMRPAQLLFGKVLGIGASALAQVAALVVAFVVAALATGSDLLSGAALHVVLVAALWLVLGYALHCTLFAAAGSLVTRESEASNVTFPVVLPLLLAYALSFSVVFSASGNPFYHVLAYIPPCAPVASTTMYAIGAIGIGEVAISAVICALTTLVFARVAARIYERSILRTGARVRLREALREA